MSETEARGLIASLMDAAHDVCLAEHQDGGKNVDIIESVDKPGEVMTIDEAERRLDVAIKAAWETLTGRPIPRGADPFEFVHSE